MNPGQFDALAAIEETEDKEDDEKFDATGAEKEPAEANLDAVSGEPVTDSGGKVVKDSADVCFDTVSVKHRVVPKDREAGKRRKRGSANGGLVGDHAHCDVDSTLTARAGLGAAHDECEVGGGLG